MAVCRSKNASRKYQAAAATTAAWWSVNQLSGSLITIRDPLTSKKPSLIPLMITNGLIRGLLNL